MSPRESDLALNIKSLTALAYRLGLPKDLILSESLRAGRYYRPFTSRSRPPQFATIPREVKERAIDNPVDVIKEIQNRIYQRLLTPLPWPLHICGGIKGKSLLDNINQHLGTGVVVTLDIKSFFPSITTFHVYDVWSDLLRCSPEVAALLTRLTTFERHLPQGASTSSALANLVLYSLDQPIRAYCSQEGILYTTWIDDLAFSGEESRNVINVAVKALRVGGFAVPHRKLRIMPSHRPQILTGLLLNRQPGVLREYVSATRSAIHKLATGCVPAFDRERYLRTLRGRIVYIRMINPRRARPLELRFVLALKTLG